MSARIYIEGGGDSKELHVRCRQGFGQLLKRCGFAGRMPRLVACGGREAAFDAFRTAHGNARSEDYVAMLVDSEDAMSDIDGGWEYLSSRDGWERPEGTSDEQVLLMVTCMETWIVADRTTMQTHYGSNLQASALPSLHNLESRGHDSIQDALVHATRGCKNAYKKGKRSFQILGKLVPDELSKHLPSFARCRRVLGARLAERT